MTRIYDMADNPVFKILQTSVFHNMGIVPIHVIHHDFNRCLETLTPAEARKMKRKFRKLWRKAVMKPGKRTRGFDSYLRQLGLAAQQPTRKQKLARKNEVLRRINQDIVEPLFTKVRDSP